MIIQRLNNWLDNRSEDARVGIYFLTGAVIAAVFVGLVFVGAVLTHAETRALNEFDQRQWEQIERIVREAKVKHDRELAAKTKAAK